MRTPWIFLASLLVVGCSTQPPAKWAEGGAPLVMTQATWERPYAPVVELLSDGRVFVGGDLFWTVDGAGRVVDSEGKPVAMLEQDGSVEGLDHKHLGGVDLNSAAPPGSEYAWLTMDQQGVVTRYDSEGTAFLAGIWRGCDGPAQQTCMLISHLLSFSTQWQQRESNVGVSVGVGIGVGIGIGIGHRHRVRLRHR